MTSVSFAATRPAFRASAKSLTSVTAFWAQRYFAARASSVTPAWPSAIHLVPETLEEQVICYADKFYSKSRLDQEKTPEQVLRSLAKVGEESVETFRRWQERFG